MGIYDFLGKDLYKLTPEREDYLVTNPENIDSGLTTGFSEMVSGGIKQGKNNFDNTEVGFILGIDDGYAKFYIGNTTNYLNWTGTELIISGNISATSGTIGGFDIGTDYIRDVANTFGFSSTVTSGTDIRFWAGDTFANRATAPFRVDEAGNTVVKSLRRDDFHWFTMFESIDGYSKTTTGSITCNPMTVDSVTGATTGNESSMQKAVGSSVTLYSWDRDMKFQTNFRVDSVSNIDVYLWVGGVELADRHLGFWLQNNQLYGGAGNGVLYDNQELQTISANVDYTIEMRFNASTNTATFYVNGILKGTETTDIPSGSSSVFPLWAYVITGANAAKTLSIRYWDFWQAGI